MLRLEMGGHTDTVNAFAVAAGERWAVTVLDDQTGRVWDLAGRQIAAVLRPASHQGSGKLSALAISADGERVVVGGLTEERWYGSNAAFVFDRQGRLLRVLEGMHGQIARIAFTSGDHMLVIASSGGIQIFDGQNFQELGGIKEKSSRSIEGFAISSRDTIAYEPSERRFGSLRDGDAAMDLRSGSCDPRSESVVHARVFERRLDTGRRRAGLLYQFQGARRSSYLLGSWIKTYCESGYGEWGAELDLRHGVDTGRLRGGGDGRARAILVVCRRGSDHDVAMAGFADALQSSGSCGAYVLSKGADQSLYRFDENSGPGTSPLIRLRAPVAPIWLGRADDWKTVAVPQGSEPVAAAFHLVNRALEGTVPLAPYSRGAYTVGNAAFLANELRSGGTFRGISNTVVLEDRSGLIVSHPSQLQLVKADGRVQWSVSAPNIANLIALSGDGKVVAAFFADGMIRWYRLSER